MGHGNTYKPSLACPDVCSANTITPATCFIISKMPVAV